MHTFVRAGSGCFARWGARLLLVAVLFVPACIRQSQNQSRDPLRCTAYERMRDLLSDDPSLVRRRNQINQAVNRYVKLVQSQGWSALHSTRTIIPVVVHVVYHTPVQNISDAQIQNQIDILNADFRRLNSDVQLVPAPFVPFVADSRIEFRVAVRDPNCLPTHGITRTETDSTVFVDKLNNIKRSSKGGHDPWPSDRYLNIWVAPGLVTPNGGETLGYAYTPGIAPEIDGVAIEYNYFGSVPDAWPYHLGRVVTHEVGHYFNLEHIWGDDGNTGIPDFCAGTDLVDDTPNQAGPTGWCPTFPTISCNNQPDGDMYVNFLDYTVDSCMVMFSTGQALRMVATLYTTRASLLSSGGLIPPQATGPADLFSQDTPEDIGAEPNTISTKFYHSEDIWVRRQDDGLVHQEHETPIHRPTGPPNWVYVRIRNRGCKDALSATVKLYWAKASTGLGWPAPWDGSVTSPALMGGAVGSQATGVVAGQGAVILKFAWNPPNPANYASFGGDRAHFCLLSRIETASSPPFGMTFPESAHLNNNVRHNNNIVWKNLSIAEPDDGNWLAYAIVANYQATRSLGAFGFAPPDTNEVSIFSWGRVIVDLGPDLHARWRHGGKHGNDIDPLTGTRVEMLGLSSTLTDIDLLPGEVLGVHFEFVPRDTLRYDQVLQLDFQQYEGVVDPEHLIGGVRVLLKDAVSL